MKKNFFFAAMAALALVGCNDKTQSELTDEMVGLSGEAKIEVSFYYNQGKHEVNGVAFEGNEYVPSTVEVIATVDYSAYSNQTKGQVFKQFVATRTGEGTYALTIPAGEKKIHVEVLPKGFAAKYWNTLTESVDAYYKLAKAVEFDVLAGNSYVQKDPKETTMAKSSEALNNVATVEFTVSGKVTGVAEELESKNKEYTHKTKEINMSNVAIKLEVSNTEKDKEGNLVDTRKLTYNATTNSNGEYNAVVKLFNGWDFDNVVISVEPVAYTAQFTHYFEELNQSDTEDLAYNDATWKNDKGKEFDGWGSHPTGIFDWQNMAVDGYWKGNASDITLSKAKVELAKKESDHNLTMTFVPLQLKKVPGITEGEEYVFEACDYKDKDDKNAKYTEHKVKQYNKTVDAILTALGWDKL